MLHLEWAKRLKAAGAVLGRGNLAQRAVEIMIELTTKSASYKEAMIAAGRLKAIASAAKFDCYWTEKVDDGFHREMEFLEATARKISAAPKIQLPDHQLADASHDAGHSPQP